MTILGLVFLAMCIGNLLVLAFLRGSAHLGRRLPNPARRSPRLASRLPLTSLPL